MTANIKNISIARVGPMTEQRRACEGYISALASALRAALIRESTTNDPALMQNPSSLGFVFHFGWATNGGAGCGV